jgi:hypothetical protein
MTGEEFIKRIRVAVYEPSIDGTITLLKEPPGRRPSPQLSAESKWFNGLTASDKEHLRAAIELAARGAIFGMLAVLDGVTPIRESGEEAGSFELRYTTSTTSDLLNDPAREFLHDLFVAEIPPS